MINYPVGKYQILLGPDHSFRYYEDPEKFNTRVEAMVDSLRHGWKPVPLIVSDLWNQGLELSDGAHRAEALKRLGVVSYPTVFYFKSQNLLDEFPSSNWDSSSLL